MLEKLKDVTDCPHCGCAKVISESRNRQHCSLEWNEYRHFDCGWVAHYFPDFERVISAGVCQRSDEYREKQEKRRQAEDKLVRTAQCLDVDIEFKSKVIGRLLNWNAR